MYTGENSSGTGIAPELRTQAATRRTFLGGTALIGAGALAACGGEDDSTGATSTSADPSTSLPPVPKLDGDPFALGVASGDPDDSSVILWTRVTTDPSKADGGVGDDVIPVTWEVATDEKFADVVAKGVEVATADFAHAVHATADGLEADSTYWYRFSIGDAVSLVGRTRTMPAEGEQPASGQFRFAMATCQDFHAGRYAAWGDAAKLDDLDAIVFLGDYIYELPNLFTGPDGDTSRQYTSDVPTDLPGFRARYSQTKGDVQLQAAHATAPFFATWDDHEVVNNYTKNVDPELRQAAYQAWWEHMPVRLPAPENGDLAVYRTLDVGGLIQLFILDTRQYSDEPPCPGDDGLGTVADCDARTEGDRTLIGDAQKTWLLDGLKASTATWTGLANPVIFAGLVAGTADKGGDDTAEAGDPKFFMDTWDGFPAERAEIRSALAEVDNPVILTGDYHASFVLDVNDTKSIPPDDGDPVCPEFLVTAISSILFSEDYSPLNPQVRYFEAKHGYAVCTVSEEQFSCEFRYVEDVWDADSAITVGPTWAVTKGEHVAEEVPG